MDRSNMAIANIIFVCEQHRPFNHYSGQQHDRLLLEADTEVVARTLRSQSKDRCQAPPTLSYATSMRDDTDIRAQADNMRASWKLVLAKKRYYQQAYIARIELHQHAIEIKIE